MKNLSTKTMCALLSCLLGIVLNISQAYAYSLEKGVFLIANEQITDPRFRDRVILLIQHDAQGSAGLVVNRASRLPLKTVLAEESRLAEKNKTLSYGGPVEPNTILALVKVRNHPPEPADVILDNIYLTGVGILDDWPDYNQEVIDFRPFVGYTGWAPGQLVAEMERGDWKVVSADEQTIFTAKDESSWEVLRSEPGTKQ